MRVAAIISSAVASVLPTLALAGTGIVGLGHLNATDRTNATAISADGNYVIGFSASVGGLPTYTPLRWSISGAPTAQQLPFPAGWSTAQPTDVSADGNTVIGWRQQGSEFQGFRWTSVSPAFPFTTPSGWSQVRTRAVSPNGALAVGSANISGVGTRAVLWFGNSAGSALPLPPGYTGSTAAAYDSLGRIYGTARDSDGTEHLGRWTANTLQTLTQLPAIPNTISSPSHTSADGSTIAGLTSYPFQNPSRDDGWVWTAALGFTPIPTLPGMSSTLITDISADGGLVLGTNFDSAFLTQSPFVWTRDRGTVPLAQFLTEAGVDLAGWTVGSATGISADGTKLVGSGLGPSGRPEAFLAIIPVPSTLLALGGGVYLASCRRRRRL